MITKKL
jgi:hypothetical protein